MRYLKWIAVAGLVAACDSPLDTDPTASIDAAGALTTQRGIELALNGAYRSLQSGSLYARVELAFPDMYTDNLNYTGTFTGDREVSIRAILPSNGEVGGIWSAAYVGINRANYILDALTTTDVAEADKNRFRGEALWIRATMYHLLAKYYGGVPLVEAPTKVVDESINPARSTLAETNAFIIKDLEEAATLLSASRNSGRATQGAANALLARMYLETGDNAKAVAKATSLIGNSSYRLLANYNDLWTGSNKNSTESIYEVQFTTANGNSTAFWFYPTPLGGRLGFAPSTSLIAAYEAGDTRRAASIATHTNGQVYGFKYRQVATGNENISVVRLAEMYLIRAEANARLNAPTATVHADINIIRNRAGLGNLPATVTTQAALLDAILQERRVELAFEGFRLMDLKRHGKALALLGVPAERLLWPVPQYERDVNPNLLQNPGY
jgi:hypothetical protein